MPEQPLPPVDRLAAALRITVGTLVRATRSSDRLEPIPATVLDLIDRNGPMTTAELAAGRGVRHQTMAATVKELSDAGYLIAGPDPADARKRILALTTAGRSVLEADRHGRVGAIAEAMADSLSEDELRVLADALPVLDRIAARIAEGGSPADRGPVTGAW
ncbi:MarR family transcriptional regulator [Streptacidiphilus pinicola]|uniref:MarR family transcriptional regulator n=1 Tax=Streptacidiphilus pinicola TaxID=2219663 RepID=A0A2X0ILY4_9ACTN|nr:MarR family winged helix-turn-helix transcriptional regulator [Streptacidiphilus pinicola]RAG86132.1 MarR family transcriptional regulator [Streptacidiphilus pinicola]